MTSSKPWNKIHRCGGDLCPLLCLILFHINHGFISCGLQLWFCLVFSISPIIFNMAHGVCKMASPKMFRRVILYKTKNYNYKLGRMCSLKEYQFQMEYFDFFYQSDCTWKAFHTMTVWYIANARFLFGKILVVILLCRPFCSTIECSLKATCKKSQSHTHQSCPLRSMKWPNSLALARVPCNDPELPKFSYLIGSTFFCCSSEFSVRKALVHIPSLQGRIGGKYP